MISRKDFLHLKWSIFFILSVVCAGSIIIVTSNNFLVHSEREQQDARNQLNTARYKLATATEDRQNRTDFAFEYNELLKQHLVGDDQRLDWIEGLENIRRQHRVIDFKYTMAPQHPYTLNPPMDQGNFILNISDMTLQFDLLHEGQLVDFFDTLRTDIVGWFILDHCSLERSIDTNPNIKLKAECTGGWLTLKSKGAK